MTVGRVKDFKFPSDGKVRVKGYERPLPSKPKMDPNVGGEAGGPLSGRSLRGYSKGGKVCK